MSFLPSPRSDTEPRRGAADALSERRRSILKIIVQQYIDSALPVASEAIARGYGLGVSAATIRNEMAALEEMGYIVQQHTSGGRVPSERGYRFYVEHLMDELTLTTDEQRTIAHQFHQANLELTQWLRLAAAILSRGVQNAAVVTAPRTPQARFKHLELISIQESLALLVAVFEGGTVQQQMFIPAMPVTQEALSGISARLNRLLEGCTIAAMNDLPQPADSPIAMQALDLVGRIMRSLDEEASTDTFVDGLGHILSQPEFAPSGRGKDNANSALQIVQMIQQGMLFNELIRQISNIDGLQIIIGGDGSRSEMPQVSLVFSRYGSATIGGLLGVLGPMRMHYGRAVSMVRFISQILGEMTTELSGHE
ncbi:MAG TPA: heat-inducible transcriptional repressor HrcA [Chloroflexota bacterium]|nr:heat-inducible transcriptional repressor HrcA [Chloroflexota bacterium]